MVDEEQKSSEVVSIGQWMLAYFLCGISCGIGFIVYCFNDNKNLSNWAKAYLIFAAASVAVWVVWMVLLGGFGLTLLGNELDNSFSDVTSAMDAAVG